MWEIFTELDLLELELYLELDRSTSISAALVHIRFRNYMANTKFLSPSCDVINSPCTCQTFVVLFLPDMLKMADNRVLK